MNSYTHPFFLGAVQSLNSITNGLDLFSLLIKKLWNHIYLDPFFNFFFNLNLLYCMIDLGCLLSPGGLYFMC
jgi:hypothetical protein